MLSRSDLKSLQAPRDYPSVSILAPTHRTAPSNKQDPIKVRSLVRKAIDRLHGELRKREVAAVVNNLQQLVRQVDWQHTLDGLALFASREQSAAVSLPSASSRAPSSTRRSLPATWSMPSTEHRLTGCSF